MNRTPITDYLDSYQILRIALAISFSKAVHVKFFHPENFSFLSGVRAE